MFYPAALLAIKRAGGPLRTYYECERVIGKGHVRALIVLARRLVLVKAPIRDNRFTTKALA
jgi:hypothetical protein